jgi:hypothetical protein
MCRHHNQTRAEGDQEPKESSDHGSFSEAQRRDDHIIPTERVQAKQPIVN